MDSLEESTKLISAEPQEQTASRDNEVVEEAATQRQVEEEVKMATSCPDSPIKVEAAARDLQSLGYRPSKTCKRRSDRKKKSGRSAPKRSAHNSIGKRAVPTKKTQSHRSRSCSPSKRTCSTRVYICPICGRSDFLTSQALGGHKSKAHPGLSPDYTSKQLRREERKADRELHRLAKAEYYRQYPQEEASGKYNRSRLTLIKDSLR